MLVLAALGLADTIYLTVRHYQNQAVGCVVGSGWML